MKTAKEYFDEYAVSHQNETNQTIHYICVPLIFFSVIGLLMSISTAFLENLFDLSNHILENWAHKISFNSEEIDKERGVVVEELRSRKGASERVFNKQLPVLYKGSRHAVRLPIGKQDILENGKHEDLIRFYKDWYLSHIHF